MKRRVFIGMVLGCVCELIGTSFVRGQSETPRLNIPSEAEYDKVQQMKTQGANRENMQFASGKYENKQEDSTEPVIPVIAQIDVFESTTYEDIWSNDFRSYYISKGETRTVYTDGEWNGRWECRAIDRGDFAIDIVCESKVVPEGSLTRTALILESATGILCKEDSIIKANTLVINRQVKDRPSFVALRMHCSSWFDIKGR